MNPYEQIARERKAAVLIVHARQNGITSSQLGGMTDEVRKGLAAAAGVRLPSKETWDIVLDELGVLERQPTEADPFAGLTSGRP